MSVVYGIASDISKPGVRAIKETNQALHYYAASLFAGEELTGDRFLSIQRITKD